MSSAEVQTSGKASFVKTGARDVVSRVAGWQIAGRPAMGRFAMVFRARPATAHLSQPACYAVKLLRDEWRNDRGALQRLAREALVGREVRHPHVVPVLGAQIAAVPPALVMPWLPGATLATHLAAGKSFCMPESLWIARQAASGLEALAQHGYVHGDIKPSNLFVSPEGHVTLIDLGLALRQGEMNETATVFGTREYLAPERRSGLMLPDARADIYSLGVVLAELLVSGNAPDDLRRGQRLRETPATMLARIRATVGLPPALASLLQQMLAQDPLRRPRTPAELVDRLVTLEIATFATRAWPWR